MPLISASHKFSFLLFSGKALNMYTGATMSNYRTQIVFNHTEDFSELIFKVGELNINDEKTQEGVWESSLPSLILSVCLPLSKKKPGIFTVLIQDPHIPPVWLAFYIVKALLQEAIFSCNFETSCGQNCACKTPLPTRLATKKCNRWQHTLN